MRNFPPFIFKTLFHKIIFQNATGYIYEIITPFVELRWREEYVPVIWPTGETGGQDKDPLQQQQPVIQVTQPRQIQNTGQIENTGQVEKNLKIQSFHPPLLPHLLPLLYCQISQNPPHHGLICISLKGCAQIRSISSRQ